jgi:hypothetical protein
MSDSQKSLVNYNKQAQREHEARLKTPEGQAKRNRRNRALLKKLKAKWGH